MASIGVEDGFVLPDWEAPIDVEHAIQNTPAGAVIKGMFLAPMAAELRRRGQPLDGQRERYLGFQDYPLREHMRLLVHCARVFYPELSLRQGLRKLGRGAVLAFLESTIGRVTWAAADGGPPALLQALARAYSVTMTGADVSVLELSATSARLRFVSVYSYLDSHHVGIFEGALRSAGYRPTVRVKVISQADADFALEFSELSSVRPP
ncbi:MAG: DUF2378 family protein [Polyangiaceae bacterium]